MNIFKQIFGSATQIDLTEVIKEGAFLVDVRTPAEFANGHIKGSVNIPVEQVSTQLFKFKNKKTIVVFCQGGFRSEQAKLILEKSNFKNVMNGGSWTNVKRFVP